MGDDFLDELKEELGLGDYVPPTESEIAMRIEASMDYIERDVMEMRSLSLDYPDISDESDGIPDEALFRL